MALTDSIEHKLDRGLSDIRRTGRRVGRTTRSAARDLHADVTDDLRNAGEGLLLELPYDEVSAVAVTGVRPHWCVTGGANRSGTGAKCQPPGPGYLNSSAVNDPPYAAGFAQSFRRVTRVASARATAPRVCRRRIRQGAPAS